MALILKSGHKIVSFTPEEQYVRKQSGKTSTGYLKLEPDGWIYVSLFKKYADQYHDFKVISKSNSYC